jgi:histone acetyltransferase
MLTKFPTPRPEKVASLLKQLSDYVRVSGKKPVTAIPSSFDLGSPGGTGSVGTPMNDNDSDEERPRKRSRKNGSASLDTRQNSAAPLQDDIEGQDDAIATSPRHGKKPGGKTAGKGTKPRTVIRGARGLVSMEVEPDGSQHPAGNLPDSAKAGLGQGGEEGEGDEDDDDDVPLAKRPELDDKERKRRELAKEKAREKEDEVVRRLTKGVNVDQDSAMTDDEENAEGVETWEGVKLVRPTFWPLYGEWSS